MNEMRTTALEPLRSRRVLVVEDEYMIAQEIADMLSAAGVQLLGPVPKVNDALRLIESEDRIDAALLDVNLFRELVWPVVDALLAREVPLLLATGYGASAIPPAYAQLPRFEKPTSGRELARALSRAMAEGAPR